MVKVEVDEKNDKGDEKPKEPGEEKDKKESLQVTRERVCTPIYGNWKDKNLIKGSISIKELKKGK